MGILRNISDCYQHIGYTLLHKRAIFRLEKKLDNKNTLRIFLHDMDKIILYIFFPYLGTEIIKRTHRKINKHHWFDRIQDISEIHIREMVLDWESCHYTKGDKTETAYEFCIRCRPELYSYMEKYFLKWNLGRKMKNKIRLDTFGATKEFVDIVSKYHFPVVLESSDGFRVNAKSFLGAVASADFNEIWVVSEEDIYTAIEKFVI